jgi:hypothetical protein
LVLGARSQDACAAHAEGARPRGTGPPGQRPRGVPAQPP